MLLLSAVLPGALSAQVASHAPVLAPPEAGSALLRPTGKPLARVNGAVLTDRDLAREVLVMFPYAQQHGGNVPPGLELQIRDGASKMMIFEELVYQEAKRRKMTVPPARMARAEAEFRKQFKSPEEYRQVLQQEFHPFCHLLCSRNN